jgi:hypothetical protein
MSTYDETPTVFAIGMISGAMLSYIISWWVGHGICM